MYTNKDFLEKIENSINTYNIVKNIPHHVVIDMVKGTCCVTFSEPTENDVKQMFGMLSEYVKYVTVTTNVAKINIDNSGNISLADGSDLGIFVKFCDAEYLDDMSIFIGGIL